MLVTNYYTVNGEIIGEKTTGGSRVDYLTDALGSVMATVNLCSSLATVPANWLRFGKTFVEDGRCVSLKSESHGCAAWSATRSRRN
jgi:hypothetical protein